MLTERDLKILRLLNDFGFARSGLIAKTIFTNGSEVNMKRSCQRRLRHLHQNNFVFREKDFRYGEFVYRVSRKGASILKQYGVKLYPYLPSIGWRGFIHSDYVLQVFVNLKNRGLTNFFSERYIRKNDPFNNYYPDLIAKNTEGEIEVFEIEVEAKSKERLREKIGNGLKREIIHKVHYICCQESTYKKIQSLYTELQLHDSKLKISSFENFLASP